MTLRRLARALVIALPLAGSAACGVIGAAQAPAGPTVAGAPLIAGFKSTYAASVSGAVEIVAGKNGTMRSNMKLMAGTNMIARCHTCPSSSNAGTGRWRPTIGPGSA